MLSRKERMKSTAEGPSFCATVPGFRALWGFAFSLADAIAARSLVSAAVSFSISAADCCLSPPALADEPQLHLSAIDVAANIVD